MAGVLATLATVGLSVYRIIPGPDKNPDFVYGILIIISSGRNDKILKKKSIRTSLLSSVSPTLSYYWYSSTANYRYCDIFHL